MITPENWDEANIAAMLFDRKQNMYSYYYVVHTTQIVGFAFLRTETAWTYCICFILFPHIKSNFNYVHYFSMRNEEQNFDMTV